MASINGQESDILAYVVTIVAGLSVGDPFIRDDVLDQEGVEEEVDQDVSEAKKAKRGKYYRVMQVFTY